MERSTRKNYRKNVNYVPRVSIVLEIRVEILLRVLSDFIVWKELVMTGNLVLKEHIAIHLD